MNITVLKTSADGSVITAAFHYTIPVGNNAVGVAWATALTNSGLVAPSVMPAGTGAGQISTADAAAIAAGTLREVVSSFQLLGIAQLTGQQVTAALSAKYSAAVAADQASLQAQLNFFGYTQ